MKYALLVAWREYAESAKTKGFWISIFMLPVALFLSIQVPILLQEKATPTRYYVLVDQSGEYESILSSALERVYQTKVSEALNDYIRKNCQPGYTENDGATSVEALLKNGGYEVFLNSIKSHLKPGAPPFKEPRREFQRVPLPPGIEASGSLGSLAAALKPYLRGEDQFELIGRPVSLYAAVLIPRELDKQIVRNKHRSAPISGAAASAPSTSPENANAQADHQPFMNH